MHYTRKSVDRASNIKLASLLAGILLRGEVRRIPELDEVTEDQLGGRSYSRSARIFPTNPSSSEDPF